MSYNTKNYTEQGGEKTVIGGELKILDEGKMTYGGMVLKPAAGQSISTASTVSALKDELNALMAKLQKAGLMERAFIDIDDNSNVDNSIKTLATYTNVSDFTDEWVTDAIIVSSKLIPSGTKVTITNPAIGGTSYTVTVPTHILWLSDIIKGQNEAVPTRTKLNQHTSKAFDFTVSGLEQDLTTDITFKSVISNTQDIFGTHQGERDFGEYAILTSKTIPAVTFTAEEE